MVPEVQFGLVSNSGKLVLPDPWSPWSLDSQRLEFQCRDAPPGAVLSDDPSAGKPREWSGLLMTALLDFHLLITTVVDFRLEFWLFQCVAGRHYTLIDTSMHSPWYGGRCHHGFLHHKGKRRAGFRGARNYTICSVGLSKSQSVLSIYRTWMR